jgi:hypothetical protein
MQNLFITDPRATAWKTGQTPHIVNKLQLYHTMSRQLCGPECLRKNGKEEEAAEEGKQW